MARASRITDSQGDAQGSDDRFQGVLVRREIKTPEQAYGKKEVH